MSSKPSGKPFKKFGMGKKPIGGGGGGGGGRKPFGKKPFNKKNQRFIQNAKGFGKKGNFGRGTHIEEEEFTYFMGILTTEQKTPVGLWEQKVDMANNVMEQTKTKELHLSSNQVVCKVLENLLGYVDSEHLERFFEVFGENLRPVCSDVYSSFVLQKLMETAFLRAVGSPSASEEEDSASKPKKAKNIITELKYNTIHDFTKEHRTKCSEFFIRVSKFLLNNLEDFVTDLHANHLLRNAILGLAGVYIPKTIYYNGKPLSNDERINGFNHCHRNGEFKLNETIFKVPEEWNEVLLEFPGRLQMWPHFKTLPYGNLTSALLQVICIALNTADKKALDDLGKKLVNDAFIDVDVPKSSKNKQYKKEEKNGEANGVAEEATSDGAEVKEEEDAVKEEKEEEEAEDGDGDDEDKDLPSVFRSDSAIRLLQTLISVSSVKLFKKIKTLFKDRFTTLANHKHGVFAVLRIINYVPDKLQFEEIFDMFPPLFDNCFQQNKLHLVASLSATCLRLKTKQAALITALQNTLHCTASLGQERPKAFFSCLVKAKPFEALPYDRKTYIATNGSLIIQDILHFNKPIFLVNSIFETPIKDLVEIFQFTNGSFIIDKFLTSPTIGEKSREKLVKLFEGFYLDFALQQSGSRVVEHLLKVASDAQKVMIAKELTGKENKLKGSMYGRILYNTLRLETFKLSQEQWKASWKKDAAPVVIAKTEEAVEDMETAEATDDTKTNGTNEPTETTAISPQKAKKNKKNKKRPAS